MAMKHSIKASRMARHHARMKKTSSLNLTALMDIFTILVFFLMVNSAEVQVVKNTDTITMPESIANTTPKQDVLLLQVDAAGISVDGGLLISSEDVKNSEEEVIPSLKQVFEENAALNPELTEEEEVLGRAVTIQGDKEVPYVVLRKIMATAADSNFRDISLAVSQLPIKVSDVQEGEL